MHHSPKIFVPMVDWQPGSPIPFADYEDDRDEPPDDLSREEVQLIWWLVASCFEREQLYGALLPVIEAHTDWGCFVYQPIAERPGRSRYPEPVLEVLKKLLPPGVMVVVDEEEARESTVYNMLIIQIDIWHELTWRGLDLCPLEALPENLLELRLARDLAL